MIQQGAFKPEETPGRVVQQGAFAPGEQEKRAVVETAENQSIKDLDAVKKFVGKITSDDDFHRMADLLVAIKNGRKGWRELMEPIRDTQFRAYKTTLATIKKVDDPWAQAEEIAIDEMGKWDQLRQARHRAEQEALNAQVKKEAEDHVISQAVSLVEQDQTETAEALLAQAPTVAPVYIPAPQKAVGLTQTKSWEAEVTDLLALVKEVAAGRQPIIYVLANQTALNLLAKSQKSHMQIPGVKANEVINYARKAR